MTSPITPLDAWIARRIGVPAPLQREALERWQLERLRETMERMRAQSPFHAARLAELPLPESLHDLARLPCTTEGDLRGKGLDMLCVPQDVVARAVSLQSSGTTGPAKRLFFSEQDLESTMDFFRHGMSTLVRPGQRVLILLPGSTPDSTGDLLARALARLDVATRIHGLVRDPRSALDEAEKFDAHCLVAFPLHALAMARFAEGAATSETSGWAPRSVLLCSDYIAQSVRNELTRIWNCRVFSHYGTVETGLGGGVECQALGGIHPREADLFFEILDPRSDTPLSDGQWGEITVSTLTRQAMPLLRYRTGDLGRMLPGACACTSSLKRLDTVQGRIAQRHLLPDGSWLHMGRLDETLLDLPEVLDFRAQLAPGGKGEPPRLHLRLLARPGQEKAAKKAALTRLHREFAPSLLCSIEAAPWSSSEATLGKRVLKNLDSLERLEKSPAKETIRT